MRNEKGVLYGPPDVEDFSEGARSLGEFCQTRLNGNADSVVLVSLKVDSKNYRKPEENFMVVLLNKVLAN